MLELAKAAIRELHYTGRGSIDELKKYLKIAKIIVKHDSAHFTPPMPEYQQAIADLSLLDFLQPALNDEQNFDSMKDKVLSVINRQLDFYSTELDHVKYGHTPKANVPLLERLKFALFKIEQDNLLYFKERPGRIGEEHERLWDHWVIQGESSFSFLPESKLPDDIKYDALEAVKKTIA